MVNTISFTKLTAGSIRNTCNAGNIEYYCLVHKLLKKNIRIGIHNAYKDRQSITQYEGC